MNSCICPMIQIVSEEPQGTYCSMSALYCSRYHRSADGWCWMGRAGKAFSGQVKQLVPCLPEQESVSEVSLREKKQQPPKKAEGH